MEYEIIEQSPIDERLFTLKDSYGKTFLVDIYTDGAFNPPEGVDLTKESWRAWLNTFVGKRIFIENIRQCPLITKFNY